MPDPNDFDSRVGKAARKTERFLHPSQPGRPTGFGGSEIWMFAKITSNPDTNGLQSWKRQRVKDDGSFEDFVPDTTGDHDAKEINGGAGTIDNVYRFLYVGGTEQSDSPGIKWTFQVGGGGCAMILGTLDDDLLSGDSTFNITVTYRSAGSPAQVDDGVVINNDMQDAGAAGANCIAFQDDQGQWHGVRVQCS